MGASGWLYFVPYQDDLGAALAALRREVFASKQFYPPKATRAATVDEAVARAGADGTHSILDVDRIADEPHPPTVLAWAMANPDAPSSELGARFTAELARARSVAPVTAEARHALFGTERPTRHQIEHWASGLRQLCPRNTGVWLVVHDDDGAPIGLCFAGKSGD